MKFYWYDQAKGVWTQATAGASTNPSYLTVDVDNSGDLDMKVSTTSSQFHGLTQAFKYSISNNDGSAGPFEMVFKVAFTYECITDTMLINAANDLSSVTYVA